VGLLGTVADIDAKEQKHDDAKLNINDQGNEQRKCISISRKRFRQTNTSQTKIQPRVFNTTLTKKDPKNSL
jgi:hypothetical protein